MRTGVSLSVSEELFRGCAWQESAIFVGANNALSLALLRMENEHTSSSLLQDKPILLNPEWALDQLLPAAAGAPLVALSNFGLHTTTPTASVDRDAVVSATQDNLVPQLDKSSRLAPFAAVSQFHIVLGTPA